MKLLIIVLFNYIIPLIGAISDLNDLGLETGWFFHIYKALVPFLV